MKAIEVRNISKSFDSSAVLSDVSFDLDEGETLAILGPSGSGKTTLMRIIAGLVQPDAGEILLKGKPVNHLPARLRGLGVVFQDYALFRHDTVESNIAFGLRLRRASQEIVKGTVDRMLDLIKLHEQRRKRPAQLSGGQKQRVAIARALAYKPAAMLFDEPFSGLDEITRLVLRREIRSLLRSENTSSLFITHNQEEALEIADRIAVINLGRIEQLGTPYEIYNHPRTEFVATFLGAANVLLGRWREGRILLGRTRLKPTPEVPLLSEGQAVKIVFRPEDAVLNFQPQFLDTPYYLGRGTVEEITYAGHGERLVVRLMLWSGEGDLSLVDETLAEGFPVTVTRSKYAAEDMELSPGDSVAVGVKNYQLLPHYPLLSM